MNKYNTSTVSLLGGEEDKRFFNLKPVKIMILLRKTGKDLCVSDVSRKVGMTYAHAVDIVQGLEKDGFVETSKNGRKKVLSLTRKGVLKADGLAEALKTRKEKGSGGVVKMV